MRAALATAVALLLGAARAADAPVPQGMRGKYKGTVYQQYGTADPKNPQSFECVPADASTKGGSSEFVGWWLGAGVLLVGELAGGGWLGLRGCARGWWVWLLRGAHELVPPSAPHARRSERVQRGPPARCKQN